MLLLLVVLFLSCHRVIPVSVYENALFVPVDFHFYLNNLTGITSQRLCACQCSQNPMCLTAVYVGINQRCSLLSASIWQGSLKVVVRSNNTSVLNFANKTLPRKFSKVERS